MQKDPITGRPWHIQSAIDANWRKADEAEADGEALYATGKPDAGYKALDVMVMYRKLARDGEVHFPHSRGMAQSKRPWPAPQGNLNGLPLWHPDYKEPAPPAGAVPAGTLPIGATFRRPMADGSLGAEHRKISASKSALVSRPKDKAWLLADTIVVPTSAPVGGLSHAFGASRRRGAAIPYEEVLRPAVERARGAQLVAWFEKAEMTAFYRPADLGAKRTADRVLIAMGQRLLHYGMLPRGQYPSAMTRADIFNAFRVNLLEPT